MAEQETPSSPLFQFHERDEESQAAGNIFKPASSKADADRVAMPPPTSTARVRSLKKNTNGIQENVQRASSPDQAECSEQEEDEEDSNDRIDPTESQSTQIDPKASIEPFDWNSFKQNHFNEMEVLSSKEDQIMQRFQALTQLFQTWADAGSHHEADRAQKRLNTRIAHVQNSEGDLELKREKYSRVMAAFQSALNLLDGGA